MPELTTTVDAEAVAKRAGLRAGGAPDLVEAGRCLALALEELNEALAHRFRDPGELTFDEMVLRVAVDVARATRRTDAGGQSTQLEDGRQVPAPRDPLASVRPRLARYVVGIG